MIAVRQVVTLRCRERLKGKRESYLSVLSVHHYTKLLSRFSYLLSFSPLRFIGFRTFSQSRATMTSLNKSDEEWRAILSPEQASIALVG
jgi:hypothetical protein